MDEICWGQAVTLCKLPLGQSEIAENNFVKSLFYVLQIHYIFINNCHPKIIRDHFPVHLYIVTLSSLKIANLLGLLRVSEYSDTRGYEYKIEYEYSSLPKSLDCDLFFFFFFFFFYPFLTETRSFHKMVH